jgi:hypothetical protein
MRLPREYLPQDLKTLRYLDALDAGDLETVAALWEEASRDPDLERILTEFDGALFEARLARSGSAGAQRVPGLSAKKSRPTRRRWAAWVGLVGTAAAACLLAVLAWSMRRDNGARPSPAVGGFGQPALHQAPDEVVNIPAWPGDRRLVDGAELATFHWPLLPSSPMTPPTSISPDLLD